MSKALLNDEELKFLAVVMVPSGNKQFDLEYFTREFKSIDFEVKEKWFDDEYDYNNAVAANNHRRAVGNKIISILNKCSNKQWEEYIQRVANLIVEYRTHPPINE